jgi:hypothetical protein
MALKMRQSLAELEREFWRETEIDQRRREMLRREAAKRSRKRQVVRRRKRSSMRFWVLVSTLIATAIIVTVGMFFALYSLLA